MTRTKQHESLLLRSIGLLFVLAGFFAFLWPVALLPVVKVLPYMQSYSLCERVLWSSGFYLFVCIVARGVSSPQQLRAIKAVVRNSAGNAIGLAIGLAAATYTAAWLSANIFGSLVKVFPNTPYESSCEIIEAVSSGWRYKSVDIECKLNPYGEIRYLTLSSRLFDYPTLNSGDSLVLSGRKNFFGVYIESYEQHK